MDKWCVILKSNRHSGFETVLFKILKVKDWDAVLFRAVFIMIIKYVACLSSVCNCMIVYNMVRSVARFLRTMLRREVVLRNEDCSLTSHVHLSVSLHLGVFGLLSHLCTCQIALDPQLWWTSKSFLVSEQRNSLHTSISSQILG